MVERLINYFLKTELQNSFVDITMAKDCTLKTFLNTMYTSLCTLHCTPCTSDYSLPTTQCTPNTAHCILYVKHTAARRHKHHLPFCFCKFSSWAILCCTAHTEFNTFKEPNHCRPSCTVKQFQTVWHPPLPRSWFFYCL